MLLNQEYVKECLIYDPNTGVFTWKQRPLHHFKSDHACKAWNGRYANKRAGCYDKRGYLFISLNNKLYTGHQLAFMFMKGWFPEEIDHKNRVKSDNRWSNLRDVDRQTNTRNSSQRSDNVSGRVGVTWNTTTGKWVAQIGVSGSVKYLGVFEKFDDAVASREKAEKSHRFNQGHGEPLVQT